MAGQEHTDPLRRQFLQRFFHSAADTALQMASRTIEVEDPPPPAQPPALPATAAEPAAPPAPPPMLVICLWPGSSGLALARFAAARAPEPARVPLQLAELPMAGPEELSLLVAGADLLVLPLTEAATLHAHFGGLRLLGLLGPEPALLLGPAPRAPILVVLGDGMLETVGHCLAAAGAAGPWPSPYLLDTGGAVLAALAAGPSGAALLCGETLDQALALPGVQVLADPWLAWQSRPIPPVPWLPLTGLFATSAAWAAYPATLTALTDELAAHLAAGTDARRYHPAPAVRPWLEPFLTYLAAQVPDACGGAAPSPDFYGEV